MQALCLTDSYLADCLDINAWASSTEAWVALHTAAAMALQLAARTRRGLIRGRQRFLRGEITCPRTRVLVEG